MRRNCQNRARGRRLVGWLLIVSLLSAWLLTVEGQEFVVEQQTLPNGLRVWVSPLEQAKSVYVGVVVLAGHADTAPWPRQTAHLLEHLLSQSRAGESKEELSRELRRRGCSRNAYAGRLSTVFWASGPPDELRFLLELLRDRVLENDLSGKDTEAEKRIMEAEYGGKPSWLLKAYDRIHGVSAWGKVCAQVLPNSPVFQCPAFPTLDLPLIDRQTLEGFYQRYYSPSRAVLIVVGPVDLQEVLQSAEAVYGGLPARSTPELLLKAPDRARRLVLVEHQLPVVFEQQSWVQCGVRVDGWRGHRLSAGNVLRELLAERLYDELVVRRALLYSVCMHLWLPTDTGVLYCSAAVDEGDVEEVVGVMKGEVLRLGREGLSAEEFARLKRSVESDHREYLSDASSWAGQLAMAATGLRTGSDELLNPLATLSSLRREEVNDLAREIFREDNMFIATGRPLLNVWQSTLALIIIVAVFVGLVVLAVRWRRWAKKAAAQAAQSCRP